LTDTPLKHTPLHAAHVRLGARMVQFAGYDMPVQYEGILAEARAVRTGVGMFDVSHMGRFMVEGDDARALLDYVHTAAIGEGMETGRSRYGLFCNEQGGIIDDGIIYRREPRAFLVIANAANAATVWAWLERWHRERFPSLRMTDITDAVAMIAVQGPKAIELVRSISNLDPERLKPFRIGDIAIQGGKVMAARTGYTGEDGVELMPSSEDAEWLWELLRSKGAVPCGLGARDTLRLEAALPLHGNDIDASTNPIEAGLDRFVQLDAPSCSGVPVLRQVVEKGPERKLIGFRTLAKGALPRPHSNIIKDGAVIGQVTSGGYSPTLDANIGLGYVPAAFAEPGTPLQIDVRGRLVDAEIVTLPFYKRPR